MSQSEYDVYKESLLAYWESKGALETARLEGRIEGEQIGLQKGEQKKALEIAKNAIQLGLSNEEISKLTGLSVDEVSKLRNEK
jgi:predicted transposase/invertase (TIGR01784 family)